MTDNYSETKGLLTEIRDIQKESLQIARDNHSILKRQFERAEALHGRAERIQERSEGLMKSARKALAFILPVIVVLLIYLTWLIFR